MFLKLKNIANASIFALASLGSAIASTELLLPQQPAFAEESLGNCIQDLRDRGVSTRDAARICRYRRDRNDRDDRYDRDDDDDRDNRYDVYDRDDWEGNRDRRGRGRYIELRARSGPTPEGRWRYSAPGIPYEAMQRAGCQNVSGDDWRCPSRRIRVQIRDERRDQWRDSRDRDRNRGVRYIDLRARSGPTPEGRWRYSAPGVPYDAMQRAGCQNVSGDDWRCPTSRIRVQVTERY
ncbi:hypothetical protein CLI64_18220 [Nostoc sp. CENA543]|uniref:hypothetical protein n=1 Tax=Nostoc sp. CENA543 TaxID=1869241 RepID=UPI000CA0A82B|nr:hypothetical protein [Nostoc sp. CENA543]AUT02163.1 hypothetical protein CLI64_18220 [Nostoc sp. CENA543]